MQLFFLEQNQSIITFHCTLITLPLQGIMKGGLFWGVKPLFILNEELRIFRFVVKLFGYIKKVLFLS
jgi:hypothetical protein